MTVLQFINDAVLAANDVGYGVGSGRIKGGWEFVWASYGITWATLVLYAFSLWVRRPGKVSKEQP